MLDSFSTALVPSVSIEALIERRNAMAERIRQAHGLLVEVQKLSTSMGDTYLGGSLSLHFDAHRRHTFGDYHETHGADDGATMMVKRVDAAAWQHLMSESGLRTFMDARTREEWNEKIRNEDVPELTIANICATFSRLYDSRGDMFEEGVVTLFRSISHDYKRNLYVKLGKRLVMTHAVNKMKHWLSGPEHNFCDKMDDLIRVMSVLDGKPEPDHRNATWYALNEAGWMKDGSPVTLVTLQGYVAVRGYKNGNAHLEFLRPDLVDGMNRIIAKRHPDALPEDSGDTK